MSFNWKSWFRKSVEDELQRSFDPWTHSITVIQENHRMIHDGFFYTGNARDAAVANGAKFYMLIQVPAFVFVHLQIFKVTGDGGPLEYDLHEGTTFSDAGTPVEMFNRNRNSSNTLGVTVTQDPTVTVEGPVIDFSYIPDPGGGNAGVIDSTAFGEFLLEQGQDYLIGVHNISGQARDITASIAIYQPQYPEDGTAIATPPQS